MAGDVQVGDCTRDNPREYLREVDRQRGRGRVWILVTHSMLGEGPLIVEYLDSLGRRLDEFRATADDNSTTAAFVLLYDLSDPRKLATTSPEEFPVSARSRSVDWTCYGTMSPLPGRDGPARAAVMEGR